MRTATLFTLSYYLPAAVLSDGYNAIDTFGIFPLSLWPVPQEMRTRGRGRIRLVSIAGALDDHRAGSRR
jgi:hypothetical protein